MLVMVGVDWGLGIYLKEVEAYSCSLKNIDLNAYFFASR